MRRMERFWRVACIACITVLWCVNGCASSIPQAEEKNQMIRVRLSRLALSDRLDLTLNGAYQLTTGQGVRMLFPDQSEVTLLLNEKSLFAYYEGMSFEAGGSVRLERMEGNDTGSFSVTNYPALYHGDLLVDVQEEKLRPILSIHVEDYLLGVVPYEMSDSFPLEALKAQAVAARTYALRKQNPKNDYDVVDTTNDQVFYGYLPGNRNAERAVRETRGVCGFYKGTLAQCYYSASNGGQTELVQTVWPTDVDYGYYAFGEDPYDLANPLSVVKRYKLQKQYRGNAPDVLLQLALRYGKETIEAQGATAQKDTIRVDGVDIAAVGAPVSEGSRLMTRLYLNLRLSGRTRREVLPVADADPEEVSLFAVEDTPQTPTASPAPTAVPEPKIVYGAYMPFADAVQIAIPIFPVAESAFGLDISSHYDNELWTVVESGSAFTLEARRYGHGVGMSQRGAQWMAGAYRKTYQEILGFYYPGMLLKAYPEQCVPLVEADDMLERTPGPAPSPTPRPTPMPLTLHAEEGERLAEVTGISSESSLNLRAEPNLSADILCRLYKGQQLIVVGESEEGWVEVRMDGLNGFVKEEFLTYSSR